MNLSKFKLRLCALWLRFNRGWSEAREMQRRIDEGRAEHFSKYNHVRWFH